MKTQTLLLAVATLASSACSQAQLTQAQRATDARTYACAYIEHSQDPALTKAKKVCKGSGDVQRVLAAAAGAEACSEVSARE